MAEESIFNLGLLGLLIPDLVEPLLMEADLSLDIIDLTHTSGSKFDIYRVPAYLSTEEALPLTEERPIGGQEAQLLGTLEEEDSSVPRATFFCVPGYIDLRTRTTILRYWLGY